MSSTWGLGRAAPGATCAAGGRGLVPVLHQPTGDHPGYAERGTEAVRIVEGVGIR